MSLPTAHIRTDRTARSTEVDALRGFALLGILLVNALMMAGPYGFGAIGESGGSVGDRTVTGLVQTLVAGKFYLMFSFLFGYSLTFQTAAAERDGARPVPRLLRRSLGLFVLGLLHAVLLFPGDILMTYALLGLILIAVRNCAAETARRAARIVYGVGGSLLLLVGLASLLLSETGAAELDAELAAESAALAADYRTDPAGVLAANIAQLPDTLLAILPMGGLVVAAFLTGLYGGRRDLLTVPTEALHRAKLRRRCLLWAAAGLPGSVFMALAFSGPWGPRWVVLGEAVGAVTAPALTFSYICGALLLLGTTRGARLAALLAPAGRMALTNYLSQSLVLALVFTAYGLALYDRVPPAAVIAGAFTLYAGQLALSGWLMARYRYGPVERLLRTVTYARLRNGETQVTSTGVTSAGPRQS
ncbi:DUF418 domain-containing protein [Streptomyces qinzhouensis]|uniref:DUF418 domain-containing protein n=1 Tax=Streptomyces qinzhouensis TaxID=2599401 RepID=UPI001FE4C304|nr:DUF418 domain-containing protein [Streptomyces qinzhouensis]